MFYLDNPVAINEFEQAYQIVSSYFNRSFGADNLITFNRNLTFTEDQRLVEAIDAAAHSDLERSLIWRVHVACWAAQVALQQPGDFVECGVFQGFMSDCISRYLNFSQLPRQFWLYDTFQGLVPEYATEEELKRWNPRYQSPEFSDLYNTVCQRFAALINVRVVQGALPDSLAEQQPEQIAFLHLDLNAEKAELGTLAALYGRIVSGGVILLDDFGWLAHRSQMQAELAFFEQHQQMVLELPTGQGLVIKN
jgi:O-methyltransferase